MINKIILVFMIIGVYTGNVFSNTYSEEMNTLQNEYYAAEGDIEILMEAAIASGASETEKQTYKNIIAVMKMRASISSSKRESYNILKKTLDENEPLLSEDDSNYITSVADLMVSLIEYSSLTQVMKLSGKADKLYEKVLKIDPNHFQALIGQGIATSFRPKFVGGGLKKGMLSFKKAEVNAKEAWEKHLIYVWLSQAYMEMDDNENYEKYITLAESIFPDGIFFNKVKDKNDNEEKSMFDDTK